MSLLVNIGILFCIIAALAVIVGIVIVKYREEPKDKDNPYCINFLSGQTEGRAIGVEKTTIVGKNGRRIVKFSPKDIYNDNLIEIPDVEAVVDQNKIISLPKGTLSKDKNINIFLPATPDRFPDPLKQHEFGKMLMFWTSLKSADNALIDSLKEGMLRQTEHLKSLGGGEVSVEKMTQIHELFEDTLNAVKESKKDKTSTTFTPPSYGSQTGG
jgi:hypothetical protein